MANIVLRRNPISGDCIMVKSGQMKPSFIINAVSPKPNEKNMPKILQLTFNNILDEAHRNLNIRNIAIPLLSTGNYLNICLILRLILDLFYNYIS